MSLSINTNVAALTAHRNMVANDNNMTTSLTRLSTGLRINSAADDASGLTIADSLSAQADGIGQGIRNANDGVSIVQTADGALEESVSIVNTIKTKAIQAASDTQTSTTRTAIQQDIDKLMEELDSIATTTSYNGIQLLNGSYTNKIIHTGASANETASINIGDTESDSIGHISTATFEMDDEDGGEIQLTINSAITGEDIQLESLTIEANNQEENGLGALADEINSASSLTGVSANAVVETTTEGAIQEGTTNSDFAINGVTIGAINVKANDADASLVTAINDKTTQTGVSAAINDNGAITITSDDGRVLDVTGELNGVFGKNVTADDLSTIGYITLTQEGSSQFNITGTSVAGLDMDITVNSGATYSNNEDVTLAAGSTIASGSILSAGTVIGGDLTVSSGISNTSNDYELTVDSKLISGSILAAGTVIGGDITLDTTDVTIDDDMKIGSGSTLLAGTILGQGTVFNNTTTVGSETFQAGEALEYNVIVDSGGLTLNTDMTLSAESTLAGGSTLSRGTELVTDHILISGFTVEQDMTLKAGSTIADTSILTAGSTIGDFTTTNAIGSTAEETLLGANSTLEAASIIAEGSDLGSTAIETVQTVVSAGESLTLEAGSIVASGTILAAGTTINQDMKIAGTEIKAGTTITEALTFATGDDFELTEKLTIGEGSTLEAGSEVIFGGESISEAISLSDQESLTLADISVLTQEDAEIAITIAEAALADLDATRSSLGSVENQLSSTISNLSVTKTNVTASESTIRDVDFAEETANFAKLSLLAQTGSYALSQANAASSNLTSLLQ